MSAEVQPARAYLRLLGPLAFWMVFVPIGISYQHAVKGSSYELKMLPFDLLLIGLGWIASIVLAELVRHAAHGRIAKQLSVSALLVAATVYPFELSFRGFLYLLGQGPSLGAVGYKLMLATSMFWLAPFGLIALSSLALALHADARERERQAIEAREQAQQAQVRALRYQINPHFLYNTLNSISALIMDGRNDDADAMVIELAAFFRASLSVDPLKDVPLKDEIEHQLLYLGIEQSRFVDRVHVTVDVPPELANAGVPSFILQPIVENSMKHGLRGANRRLHLQLAARAEADSLVLEVADDGPGSASLPGTGTGLVNVERRLRTRHGERAGLEAKGGCDGFRVKLTMPLTLCA